MAKVKIALRLPPEHKAMLDRFDNPSGVTRRFIAAGLAKANAPGTKEIEKMTEILEELRRIGGAVRHHRTALGYSVGNAKSFGGF